MRSRARRVYTPETIFDRLVLMAIERGRLADLLCDPMQGLGYRALGRVIALVEQTSFVKAVAAIAPLRSVLLRQIVERARCRVGEVAMLTE